MALVGASARIPLLQTVPLLEKRERLLRGEIPYPFIDPHGYRQMIAEYEQKFRARKREQESKLKSL